MAEFEELRLTVNLVDNASAGLQKLRAEIGQLTTSTDAMTASLTTGVASVTNLGTATTNAAPQVRSLSQHMRDAARSSADLKDGFLRLGVATQGLTSLPQIASSVRDMGLAVQGLGSAFSLVGTTATIAVSGIAAVAVGVAALGAVVIAYGVSVFKFAREMDQLSKTAKQMGMGFAELKYAQDQAKRFNQSAEAVTRSYQGIQAAQLDLYKNNSDLRARLLAQGVDAGWIAQLQTLDPTSSRNAIIRYGKALEQQALASGAGANVAAALKNQFGKEFGVSKEDMAGIELPPPSPETMKQLEDIDKLSGQISDVWRQMVHQWNVFSTDLLAAGLPVLLDGMKRLKGQMPKILDELKIWITAAVKELPNLVAVIPAVVRRIGTELKGVVRLFTEAIHIVRLIRHPIDTLKQDFKEGRDQSHPALKGLLGGDVTPEYARKYREMQDRSGQYTMWDKEWWGGGKPSDQFLRNQGLEPPSAPAAPAAPAAPPSDPYGLRGRMNKFYQPSSFSGSNDNNPLLMRASFTQEELKDETGKNTGEVAKLTSQLEKINAFLDRVGGTGGGGGGIMNASLTTGGDIPAALGAPGLGGGRAPGAAGFGGGGYTNLGGGPNAAGGAGIPGGGYSGSTGSPSSGGTRPGGGGGAGTRAAEGGGSRPAETSSEAVTTAQGGGLAADRARFKAEMDANPALREKVLRIAANEQGKHGQGTQAVIESMMNRASFKGTSLAAQAKWTGEGGYYEQGNMGRGALENKEHATILNKSLEGALAGSNVSDYATDNASQGLARKRRANQEMKFTQEYGGESFFQPGRISGAGNVQKYAAWRQRLNAGSVAPDPAPAAVAANSNVPELNSGNAAPRPGPTVERAALAREALTADSANEVQTDGKLTADVKAPSGTKVEVNGSGAFKKTEMSRETANKLLATN